MAAIRFAVFCYICIFSVSIAFAESCQTNIPGHYANRYTDNRNGTITDNMTGLMWSKCIMGMTWDAGKSACIGPIVNEFETSVKPLSWKDALQKAATINYAGYTDWRMPNIKELASLFDVACFSNMHSLGLDMEAFDIFSQSGVHKSYVPKYWSSTPFREVHIDTKDNSVHNQVWQMNFYAYDTGAKTSSIDDLSHTRLVRETSQ